MRGASPRLRFARRLAVWAALALAAPAAAWAGGSVSTGTGGLAIRGYDPVAYFKNDRALAGSEDYEYEWNGATWRFLSAGNRALFKAEPEKYAPQYGGYSAFAIARGKLAESDPTVWSIVDEKLYLNGSREARTEWLQALGSYISSANRRWPGLESSLAK